MKKKIKTKKNKNKIPESLYFLSNSNINYVIYLHLNLIIINLLKRDGLTNTH